MARRLAFPRFPGSSDEARARALIAGRLRELGYVLEEQPFRFDARHADRLRRLVPLLPGALIAGSAVLLRGAAATRWLLLSAALPVATWWLKWPRLERLFHGDRHVSANLIARREGGALLPRLARDNAPIVLFMAHVDSKSQALSLVVRGALAAGIVAASAIGWLLAGAEWAGFTIPTSINPLLWAILGACGI